MHLVDIDGSNINRSTSLGGISQDHKNCLFGETKKLVEGQHNFGRRKNNLLKEEEKFWRKKRRTN